MHHTDHSEHPSRAIEFYAGIGGLQLAAIRTVSALHVVASYDWDQAALAVYKHNYAHLHPVHRTDISKLAVADIAQHEASVWLMSPPCQPYTVLNKNAKGHADPRASSFHHLFFALLPQLLPSCLLLENVVGFKGSETHAQATHLLQSLHYDVREFVLSPLQFGIPNSRNRYYLLAKRSPLRFAAIPRHLSPAETMSNVPVAPLSVFLDTDDASEIEQCAVPDKVLFKWAHEFDIVLPHARRTCCFTRGYTHLAQGSGSVLQQNVLLDTSETFASFKAAVPHDGQAALDILRPLRLRYFTPTELLRIFCFLPPNESELDAWWTNSNHTAFSWPVDISRKTKYKLLGNSVNVLVVARLLEYLLANSE